MKHNIISVSNFLNTEVSQYAKYSTIRAIPSYIDGLKNAGRKVVYYLYKTAGNKEHKVLNLAGEVSVNTCYLHGDITGSIVTLAKNYAGTNNLPLLTREGNFGKRHTPEASANRYIYTQKEDYFYDLYSKDDFEILEHQTFEGDPIEPRFFVPNLPMLLINGSEGIATGFACKILPRDPKKIKKYIQDYLQDKLKSSQDNSLIPYFNEFDGVIEKGENKNQWVVKGKIQKVSIIKILITELPIGYDLASYTKKLEKFIDDKKIKSYTDNSENDKFLFEVTMSSADIKKGEEYLLNKLGLIKNITENLTTLDENNNIKVFENTKDIIDSYIKVKLKYLQKRKEFLLDKIDKQIKIDNSKYLFIEAIVNNKLKVQKRKKADIVKALEEFEDIYQKDGSFDYLLNMSIYNLTEEKMKELKNKITNLKKDFKDIKSKSIQSIWIDDLTLLKI